MNAVSARAGSAIREGSLESTLAWTDDTRRHYARRAARRASGPREDTPGLRSIRAAARVVGTSARICRRPGGGLTRSILKAPLAGRLIPQNPVDVLAADPLIRFSAAAGTSLGSKTG